GADQITTGNGSDVIIGDGGTVTRDAAGLLVAIFTDSSGVGGDDTIAAGAGNDYVIGGAGSETISGEADNDLILGDNGRMDFTAGVIASATTTPDTGVGA